MPKLSTLKSLGSLFRSSINSTPAAAKTSPVVDKSLKHFVSSLDASSASTFKRTLVKSQKPPQPSKPPSPAHFSSLVSIRVYTSSCSDSDGLSADLLDSKGDSGGKPSEDALKICIENASTTDDETVALEQVSKAFEVFMSMKEQGVPIEEKVIEYYEELKASGVQVTKEFFMALINAFANCGQFEKAKQVLLYKGIPSKYLEEIKSKLVSVLASHGEMADALDIYDEIKEAGFNLAPKAAICLLEHLQHKGDLSRVLQLVEELHDPQYFADGCQIAIRYCILNKHLRHTVDLLKRLKDRFYDDILLMKAHFDKVFFILSDMEPFDLQIGLDLLQAIKDELGLTPTRKCLDILLIGCIEAKDLHNSLRVWKEYQAAGLPYNVISYLRMYKALLACQAFESAEIMLKDIPRDDPHVCMFIEACQNVYLHGHRSYLEEHIR